MLSAKVKNFVITSVTASFFQAIFFLSDSYSALIMDISIHVTQICLQKM